jgi:hypothetical protein
MKLYRQGDVMLRGIAKIPKQAAQQKKDGPIVLALGESTGHKHQILDNLDNVDVYIAESGEMYLRVKGETALRHEEHGAIMIPPGNYERIVQREYSPAGLRNVAD